MARAVAAVYTRKEYFSVLASENFWLRPLLGYNTNF